MKNKVMELNIFILMLFMLYGIAYSELANIESYDQFVNFRAQDKVQGIFFYHKDPSSGPLYSKVANLMKTVLVHERLDADFMEFALLNCKHPGLDATKIVECQSRRKLFRAYKDENYEDIELGRLYNHESFYSTMLMFAYGDSIMFAQNEADWRYEQNYAKKENKDVILQYITGMGDGGHFQFMVYYMNHMEEHHYVLTTDPDFAQSLGKLPEASGEIWYAKCKGIEDESPCPLIQYKGKTDVHGVISNFVNLNGLPLVNTLQDDGSTIYGKSEVNLIWVFVDNDENLNEFQTMLPDVIKDLSKKGFYVRGVVVDRRTHGKYMPTYGIYDTTMLPAILIQLAENNYKQGQFELFSPDVDFTKENIEKHMLEYLDEPNEKMKKIANSFPIDVISLPDWKQVTSDGQNELHVLTLGCCSETSYEERCSAYGAAFRRIVRTMLAWNLVNIQFYYVDMTGMKKSIKANNVPSLRFYKFDVYGGSTYKIFTEGSGILYNDLLKWVNEMMSVELKPLPVSGSDYVKFSREQDVDVNQVNLLGRDEVLEKLQEDEIAQDAVVFRKKFYKDNVTVLTDKTFNKTIEKDMFAVVLFYVNWDDVSYLFQPVYSRIHGRTVSDDQLKHISLYKLDCNAYDQICHQQSVNIYPVIRIFKNGQHYVDYKSLLNEESILKEIYLLSLPEDTQLNTEDISNGKVATLFSDHIIVGWFSNENKQDLELYKKVCKKYHGKISMKYSIGNDAGKLLGISSEKSSSIIVFQSNDITKPAFGYMGLFNDMDLSKFVDYILNQKMGELTAENFPSYKSEGKPFLILFVSNDKLKSTEYWTSLNKMLGELEEYSVVWMDVHKEVTRVIRRSYLGQRKTEEVDLVLLDHKNGYVYLHESKTPTSEDIMVWLKTYEDGMLSPKSRLLQTKWKPLRQGFDFLTYIEKGLPKEDDDESEDYEHSHHEDKGEVSDGTKNENVGNYGHYKPADRVIFHGKVAPKHLKLNIEVDKMKSEHDEL